MKLPVTDADGFPLQTRGVTAYPGLFFIGLPWLHTAKSGLIFGLSEDARFVADRIAERRTAAKNEHSPALVPSQSASQQPKRSRAAKTWADRVMTLVWSSALSLMLTALRLAPSRATRLPFRTRRKAPIPRLRFRTRFLNSDDGPKEVNMNKTFKMLASAAMIGLSLAAAHAAEPPLPPHVSFVTTPASQLHLGMTADDVIRVMGQAASETDVTIGATQIRKFEFADAIPGQVILSDGKLSRVTFDPFRMKEGALPLVHSAGLAGVCKQRGATRPWRTGSRFSAHLLWDRG
jgi:hypothetical protein